MTREDFTRCVSENAAPPPALSPILQSLWWAVKGDWDHAHTIVQDIPDAVGSWAHANLHREEGDLANARYWYARAEKRMPTHSIEDERNGIIDAALSAV